MSETRKLAAILVADVVGYSRLAGADEEGTLARLRPLRRMTALARTPALPEATPVGPLPALCDHRSSPSVRPPSTQTRPSRSAW
jgi:hypothetical protein